MVRRLSPRLELLLVNLICFGPFAAWSTMELLERKTRLVFDDRRLFITVAIEVVAGTLAALLLRARGWKLADLGMRVTMPLTIAGMLLLIGTIITIGGFDELLRLATGNDPSAATTPVVHASWLSILLLLAIDPLYEETFEVAYNIRACEGSGAAFAITLSAAVRFACNLYQGPVAAVTTLPMGLIFAAVYWKWRRVWPLTVAHGVATYFALAPGQ